MVELNRITLGSVLAGLDKLGITYHLLGPAREVNRVCSLLQQEPGGLYYYTGSDTGIFDGLKEAMVICGSSVARTTADCSSLVVDADPQIVFYQLCALLFDTRPVPGVHPTAIVHPEARIGARVYIGPYAVIGPSIIGDDSTIHSHVVIMDGCTIGARVVIESHSCIGATGVAWIWNETGGRVVLPQLGSVIIEEDVFLGTDVTVVRGMLNETTSIGKGCMIAHGTKIGHSVRMEADCHVANNVSIAGSARIGARSFLGAGCSIRPHAKLAEGTIVGVGAAIVKDVLEPGAIMAGVPARQMPSKEKPAGMPKPF